MKYIYLLLGIFLPLNAVSAQSILVQKVSRDTVCVGDTVWVIYKASGPFNPDNFFVAQLSDASGSFATFTNIGNKTSLSDSIPIKMGNVGEHFRFRMITTDPYTISSNTSSDVRIVNYPSPNPGSQNIKHTAYFGPTVFVEDSIKFSDATSEGAGSMYLWRFDQDANISWTNTISPTITYSTIGKKTGSLAVSNSAGCSSTRSFTFTVLACDPIIPDSVFIVTGSESGNHPYVWVKPGGAYIAKKGKFYSTVFLEAGGSVTTQGETHGMYYVKAGSSFLSQNERGSAAVILMPGNTISFDPHYTDADTLYCNFHFDYSQISSKEVKQTENPLQILNSNNNLRINCEGEMISAYIVNLLGRTIISKTDRDIISFDLSSLTNGVYFAVITSGNKREVQKLTVLH